jgi:hypothetical protein
MKWERVYEFVVCVVVAVIVAGVAVLAVLFTAEVVQEALR